MFELDERLDPTLRDDLPFHANRQYETVLNVFDRWEVYSLAADNVDFFGTLIDSVDLQGTERIADIGGQDGRNMVRLIETTDYLGKTVCMDIADLAFQKQPGNGATIDHIRGDGQNIPLTDNSIDTLFNLFALYHFDSPQQGLQEFQRVVPPDGQIIIATSGRFNKCLHRMFEQQMANEMQNMLGELGLDDTVVPPSIFAKTFNAEKAELTLPEYFDVDWNASFTQQCPLIITDSLEDKQKYERSMLSMKDNFTRTDAHSQQELGIPYEQLWKPAYDKIVATTVDQAIEDVGYFADYIDRRFYVCRNTRGEEL